MSARLLGPDALEEAAALLRAGGLVAFPTETVYGLGADATDPAALARLFEAKGRPMFNPLIAHAPDLEGAERAAALPPAGRLLAERFWPGPLTLVAPRRPGAVADLAAAGLETVGVRVPAPALARALLRAVGRPVAAPSANPSGRLSPTLAAHVREGLGPRIDAVLDGGPAAIGLESTIVSVAGPGAPVLLRPGGLPVEEIEAALGAPLAAPGGADGARPASPGRLASHYAPRAALRLDAAAPARAEAWLGFGPDADPGAAAACAAA
ncbi:MAG: L-threonylcarbamoyladenylate synthase, partial [Pseudomonadota bacterium]